jgi:very-short-patch-repair endonuclease
MAKNQLTVEFLTKHYAKDKKSTVEIAKLAGCYPEQVRRALKKCGIPVRSKAKASRNFYDNGGENSRKGYKFSEEEKEQEEKERASIVAKEYWLSDESAEARDKISESSAAMWESKTDAEKKETVSRLHQACRLASQQGSKAERTIAQLLASKYGYKVLQGVVELAGIGNLEVDIAIPGKGIIIEVDGITHFEDVYSDNRYERAQEHDKKKNEIMIGAGFSVIRVRLVCERYSKGSCLITCAELDKMISEKTYKKGGVSYIDME